MLVWIHSLTRRVYLRSNLENRVALLLALYDPLFTSFINSCMSSHASFLADGFRNR